MLKYVKKVLYILGADKAKAFFLIPFFLLSSLVEIIGIGLIVPYVSLIINPEKYSSNYVTLVVENFDFLTTHQDVIVIFSLILLMVFFFKTLSMIAMNKMIFKFCINVGVKLRIRLMSYYQSLPYGEYISRNSSEYINNIQALTVSYSQDVLQSMLRILSEGIVVILILTALAFIDLQSFLLLIILMGAVVFLYDGLTKNPMYKYGKLTNKYSRKTIQGVNESMSGFKEIRILNKEKYFYNMVVNSTTKHALASISSFTIKAMPRYFIEFILILFIVSLVLYFIFLDKGLDSLIPILSAFSVAALRLLPSINQISSGFTSFRFGGNTVDSLYKDVKKLVQREDGSVAMKEIKNKHFSSLKLKDISFTYPDRNNPALKKVSLELKSGNSIGIIGTSGSGKTTLIDVMLGLLKPQKGDILLNGNAVHNDLFEFTSKVAYIPQQAFIIDDSLKRNITLSQKDNEINEQILEESIVLSRLSSFIKDLPEGVNTVLGEGGVRLSGGQKQRISLARAFYHQRDILIMDESTSSLDNETEKEVMKEIERFKGKVTMIIIAHRMSTIQHCDYIYRFDHGEIVQHGTFSEVVGL